ncbi:hypothetical protein FF38_03166 [Lucilia cuprina]|uniref:Immunoglobulin I-set domain-containing protein n=1 Tax=Lucilia cuprina TaxID=7375 RepID=A0A0L0BP96_LUCCU|nr:hypothetical protein FF38_03166 [Lucilia cuprina]
MYLRNDFSKPEYYKDAPHFRRIGEGTEYRLEIPYAKLDFTGTYSVIASNCHGEAKAVISLQIFAKARRGKTTSFQKSSAAPKRLATNSISACTQT